MQTLRPGLLLCFILAASLTAARETAPPADGIRDETRALEAGTRAALAAETTRARAALGCDFWLSAETYSGAGKNLRAHARDLRRAWSGDKDAVLLAYDRASGQSGLSFSPGLWEKHSPAALATVAMEINGLMADKAAPLDARLAASMRALLRRAADMEAGRRRAARTLSIQDRRLAAWFAPVLGGGALCVFAAGLLLRRRGVVDEERVSFPRAQVGCRFGAPHGGGVVAVAARAE